ncbi:MAG TPA: ferritin-like domain-containing protein [Polyangiales bacterium]
MPRLDCHSPLLDPIEILLRKIGRKTLYSNPLAYAREWPRDQGTTPFHALCAGRRPSGLTSESVDLQHDKLGDFLAHMAHLEAAGVVAFERLAIELRAHGAPEELIEQALTAAEDERRHADSLSALARARGGQPVEVQTLPFAVRSVLELALENAVEGCIRETYGALVGAHQATRARDLDVRLAMRTIAPEEARHAALAHGVHTWSLTRLNADERDAVRRAQVSAVFTLARECALPPDPEVMEQAGLPDSGMACALLGELARELWSPSSQHAA